MIRNKNPVVSVVSITSAAYTSKVMYYRTICRYLIYWVFTKRHVVSSVVNSYCTRAVIIRYYMHILNIILGCDSLITALLLLV